MEWWEKAREEFPVTRKLIYMNIAFGNSMPERVLDEMLAFYRSVQMDGPARDHWKGRVEAARRKVARLLGATPGEIAFTKNTSDGINIAATGIEFRAGDNVVLNDLVHPSNREPWLNQRARGVEVRVAWSRDHYLHQKDVFELVDSRTKVISLSHLEYTTGARNDLAAYADFCRRNEILLVVDGMQSVGVLACNLRDLGVHLFAAGGHKALFGPHGLGVLFCSRDVIERVRPSFVGP